MAEDPVDEAGMHEWEDTVHYILDRARAIYDHASAYMIANPKCQPADINTEIGREFPQPAIEDAIAIYIVNVVFVTNFARAAVPHKMIEEVLNSSGRALSVVFHETADELSEGTTKKRRRRGRR